MYVPEYFKESHPERIAALIEDHSFGMLISAPEGVPFVSHLPFVYERGTGSGKLLGHMARANPQWQHFAANAEALVIFQGPHAYVSPSWYASPGVPTWNYAVVHLRGKVRLIEAESELGALVEQLTQIHETHMPDPWQAHIAGPRRTKLLNMIVGFEIEITDVQAKFKLSQNRAYEDRQRVMSALGQSDNQTARAVANLMARDALDPATATPPLPPP
ncbi:MAG: hypothetical protein B7Y50_07665 [Hydrogenophilales bacterium 28-61-11]|nr:MAG: hypothetical protein B7Y50_07665 [Hydrogenophilales bacterium 28-61-11]OYZ59022.1 MAG: hypothetical protein B7Y21_00910 [Hydrogenophilales bacterium 16-61-112]OZA45459.1 MAG: hypothetical protein B7X81_08315 [Hydrogenophilales bacterium 17-61-76]